MLYEKYVKDMIKVIETETEKIGASDLKEAFETIESAPAFTGKLWLEDTLDKVYNKKFK